MSEKKKPELTFPEDIGVKLANHKDRTIEQCLNCKKAGCNCCPIYELSDNTVPIKQTEVLRKRWTQDDMQKAADMYNKGMSCRQIGLKIGREYGAVRKKLKLLGVIA